MLKWVHRLLSTIWVGNITMCGLMLPSLKKKPNKTPSTFVTLDYLGVI